VIAEPEKQVGNNLGNLSTIRTRDDAIFAEDCGLLNGMKQ